MQFIARIFASLCFAIAISCVILAIPFAVFAADAAVGGVQPESNPWWHMVLVNALIALGAIVLGLIGRVLTILFDWLAEKTKLSFLTRVDDAAMDIITDLYASEVKYAKEAQKDGILTKEECQRFKSIATQSLKQWLGIKGIAKLGSIFNGSAEQAIGAKVEKAVTVSKNAGKLARSSAIAKALGAASDPPASSASPR